MTDTRTLKEVLSVTGRTRDNVMNWQRHGGLKLTPRTKRGEEARYTKHAALEIAFVGALNSIGISPREAGPRARAWLAEHDAGKLAPFYARNAVTGQDFAFSDPAFCVIDFGAALSDDVGAGWRGAPTSSFELATSVAIISRAEIIARIEALFAAEVA